MLACCARQSHLRCAFMAAARRGISIVLLPPPLRPHKRRDEKKPARWAGFSDCYAEITSCRREQLQPAWQRQQPEQRLRRAWQRQRREQQQELRQRERREQQQELQQREPGPERVLPSCRKRRRPEQREQQPGETVSFVNSLYGGEKGTDPKLFRGRPGGIDQPMIVAPF